QVRQKRIDYPPAWKRYPDMRGHVTTLNIGKIRGGDETSTVPDWAEFACKVGWPPGEEITDVKNE
ncbi:MAG: peptidase dimerization domain-containing protein, partial [Candidatus Aenigmarchaeota archaeon]|nr:peptidase dimerization domain-containing protein [Candidatus Aenigmarchaeota archaeon]